MACMRRVLFLSLNLLCGALFLLFPAAAGAATESFTFTTLAGSIGGTNDGANGAAQFYFPSRVAVDRAGNLFVADTSNNTIRKVAPVGNNWVVTTIAGTPAFGGAGGTNDGPGGTARFSRPEGIAVDTNGNIFVVDRGSHTIRKISPSGTNWMVETIAGLAGMADCVDGTNSDARFSTPRGIALDSNGNLFVADTSSFTIRKLSPDGTNWIVTTIAGYPFIFGPDDGTNSDALFDLPFGLTVDGSTNIYVADFGNDAIRKIELVGEDWVVTTIAGGTMGSADGTNTTAQFNSPADIGSDGTGNLFVTDQFNNTIRKLSFIADEWVTTTIGGMALQSGASNGVGGAARFKKPWGLAVHTNRSLFIVDSSNSTIREGVPASSLAPHLRIALSGTNAILSWPLSASGFTLETSSSFLPSGPWSPLTNGVVISGNDFILTRNAKTGNAFFRLHGH
jgi:NHL repeat-containing protein